MYFVDVENIMGVIDIKFTQQDMISTLIVCEI